MNHAEIEENIFQKMESSLSKYLFEQKENRIIHATLNEEMSDFVPVRNGDIKAVKKNLVRHRKKVFGKLSDSPVQQERYLFVANITTCCRICIEAGMPADESYGLSDLYIRRMDRLNTPEEIKALYEEMMLDYTRRMHGHSTRNVQFSPKIILCMNYIDNHLHDRITVQELADEIEMNASWMSTLFAKEVGMPVSEYIRKKKINAAKYLLSHNEYTCTDIAEYLGFSGESHFSSLFTRYEGISPKEYRRKYYQKQLTHLEETSN